MNPDDIVRLLDEIGQRLQGPGAHVYELVVRQVVAESIVRLVIGTLALIALLWQGPKVWRYIQGKIDDDVTFLVFGGLFVFTFAVLVLPVGISTMADSAIRLLNPEYAALERIVTTLTGK